MRAGGSKAATMIKQPALAPSPQPRPAPTARALPPKSAVQGGQNWTPIRGQICKPIDMFTKRGAQGIAQCEQAPALDRNLASAHAVTGCAKVFLGRGAETEAHINAALRLSPRDILAHRWMATAGFAKAQLGADAEAVVWLRRALDANRNSSFMHFDLAAALVRLGELDEARAAVQAGLALDPSFTIRIVVQPTHGATFRLSLAWRERHIEGMRLAGVP